MNIINQVINNSVSELLDSNTSNQLNQAIQTGDYSLIDWSSIIASELDNFEISNFLKAALVPDSEQSGSRLTPEQQSEMATICDWITDDCNFNDLMDDCIRNIQINGEIERQYWSWVALDILEDKFGLETKILSKLKEHLACNA